MGAGRKDSEGGIGMRLRRILVAAVLVLISFVMYLQECRVDSLANTVYYNCQRFDLSVLDSCGIITDGQGHGSCVAIAPNVVLTAGHCIEVPDTWIEIGDVKYTILGKWGSDEYDVGFIKIDGDLPFVKMGTMPCVLQEVYKVGYPLLPDLDNFVAKGIISKLGESYWEWDDVIILDSPGIGGQSGGAVFDKNGWLVAIHVGHISYGFGVEEPISHIRAAYAEYVGLGG